MNLQQRQAAFTAQRRQMTETFSTHLRHVQICQDIQHGTCTYLPCHATVQHVNHFAACPLKHRSDSVCEECEFMANVLIQHSLDCVGGKTCFVPRCSALKAVVQRLGNPRQLARRLLRNLDRAEVRTIVWCLGGGPPNQLQHSSGKATVRWTKSE